MRIKIRNAQLKDVLKIYLLGRKIAELGFSKKFSFHEKGELKESIKDRDSIMIVAETPKKIVGFLYAKIIFHRAGGWCMLDNLAVEQEYRQHGIGSALLELLYKTLKKKKVNYVQVLEDIHSKNTRNFWKSKGLKETKTFIWAEKKIK